MRVFTLGSLLVLSWIALGVPSIAQYGKRQSAPEIDWHFDPVEARKEALAQSKPILACSSTVDWGDYDAWHESIVARDEFSELRDRFVWLYVWNESLLVAHRSAIEDKEARAWRRFRVRFGFTYESVFCVIDPFEYRVAHQLEHLRTGDFDPLESWIHASKSKLKDHLKVDFAQFAEVEKLADDIQIGKKYRSKRMRREFLDHDSVVVRYASLAALVRSNQLDQAREWLLPFLESNHAPLMELVYHGLAQEEVVEDAGLEEYLHKRLSYNREEGHRFRWRLRAARVVGRYGDERSIARLGHMSREGGDGALNLYETGPSLLELGRREKAWRKEVIHEFSRSFPPPGPPEYLGDHPTEDELRIALQHQLYLAKFVHDSLKELTGKRKPFPSRYDHDAYTELVRYWD